MQVHITLCQLNQANKGWYCGVMCYQRGATRSMLFQYMADVDAQVGEACLDPKGPPQGASLQEAAPQAGRPTHKARQHQPIDTADVCNLLTRYSPA